VADRSRLGSPAERNDPGTLRIGSLGGVDVFVRWSWLLVAALIAYLLAPGIEQVQPGLGPYTYVAGVAIAVLLTLSLLLHELSHALMAKHFGIGVRSITLHFIGGVTAIDGEPATPSQELAISAVGPVTSLGVGGLALALHQLLPPGLLEYGVGALAGANLVIGVLNLVPGMPLDGGRVLRAAVWKVTGNPHRGTAAAGWAGRGVALLVLVWPLVARALGLGVHPSDYVLAVVFAWFLWTAASSAISSAQVRSRLPALHARTLARRVVAVPADLPLTEALRMAREHAAGSIVTLGPDGTPAGVVNEAAVLATPPERRPWVSLAAVSRSLGPGLTLSADLSGEELVLAMQRAPATEYLLVEPDGSVFGVLTTSDVDKAFAAAR
jgi:Zn-dependent protease/CBS domain-containing protein